MDHEVWLHDFGARKILAIKTVRTFTGFGLKEAKESVEAGGLIWQTPVERAARDFVRELDAIGAVAEVRPGWHHVWWLFDDSAGSGQTITRFAVGEDLVERRTGRLGESGHATSQRFDGPERAMEAAAYLVARERAAGRTVVADQETVFRALCPRSPDLDRALSEDPHDDDLYRVYADWLLEHGDVRGELIICALDQTETTGWFRNYATVPLGSLAPYRSRLSLSWHRGFLKRARIPNGSDENNRWMLDQLLNLPAALLLQELEIPADRAQQLLDRLPPQLRRLRLTGDFWVTTTAPSAAVRDLAPHLERLEIDATVEEPIALDSLRLRTLTFTGRGLEQLVDSLIAARLPHLEELEIGRRGIGAREEAAWDALFSRSFPSLKRVKLYNVEEIEPEIRDLPLTRQLDLLEFIED